MFDSVNWYRMRYFSKHSSTPATTPTAQVTRILRRAGNVRDAPIGTPSAAVPACPDGRARRAASLAAVISVTLAAAAVLNLIIVVGLLAYAILGLLTDAIVRRLERRALRWREETAS